MPQLDNQERKKTAFIYVTQSSNPPLIVLFESLYKIARFVYLLLQK